MCAGAGVYRCGCEGGIWECVYVVVVVMLVCVCVYERSYMLRCDKAMLLLEVITNLKNLPLTVSGT